MDQARRMLNMRIKIDVWSQGLSESIRGDLRDKLRELFCQLPPRRVWYYLKSIRLMHLSKGKSDPLHDSRLTSGDMLDGAEDIIVD